MVEPTDALCARLMGFFYSVELQRPETRGELRLAWIEILARTADAEGRAHLAFPFACVRARRAGAGP